ncbi:helix-turn-helix domain-containing protein [Amorphoplanes digitatis]|uniref:Excisionase family DNA binding protein n=1 Tax=Actinoplanes digitatis TaxID=1868 RepID=A0A7W7I5G0_9ACTN|nr:helix-turn-helix domain-containing protein [Actinoplanes digitatis]MBB4766810.1 excisionase family DNA binding protein [Actinoplanes digitatis]GID96410.1 MerR family transcriptional regulator [Actinoplanes digitatis]
MRSDLYSIEQVAELLGLHVRTVRNYVRDGRLKAVKIGKQYRITRADLAALTGEPATAEPGRRHVEVSSIVQIDGIGAASASRLSTLLTAGAQAPRASAEPLRIQTIHDEGHSRMKVVILGGPAETADIVRLIGDLLGPENGLLDKEEDDE